MTGREWWNEQQRKPRPGWSGPGRPAKTAAPPIPPSPDKEYLLHLAREVEDGWIADKEKRRKR